MEKINLFYRGREGRGGGQERETSREWGDPTQNWVPGP